VMHQLWSPKGFEEATQSFRQAIELEPDYVEAHGGLAFALTLSRLYQRYYEIEAQARASLQRALELDPNQHWALFAQGYLAPPDWKLAGQLFERAMEASGRAPLMTPHCVRNYFNIIERFAEAHALLDEAQERDPLSPLLPFVRARTLYAQGEFEAAVRACERSLELETHIYPSLYVVGELYARLDAVGRAEETVVRLREFNGPEDPFALYIEGLVHLAKGQSGEASEDRDHLIRNWAQVSYVPPTLIARLSIAMGDIDAGMHWFETAWHQRDYFLCDLRAQYRNEPSVWNNPQCQKLARLMNLDDESLRNL
jgi:tetratricopeptide (TPR) repeat protein